MKKAFFCLMALVLPLMACNAGDVKVTGNLKGLGDDLKVYKMDINTMRPGEPTTQTAKDGKFNFTIATDEPTQVYIVDQQQRRISFVAVPGESVTFDGDLNQRYDINGSAFYQQYHQADLMMEEAQKPFMALQEDLVAKIQAGTMSQDSAIKVFQAQGPALQKAINAKVMEYVKAHAGEDATAAIIAQLKDPDFNAAYALLTPAVKEGRMKTFLEAYKKMYQREREKEEAAAKKQAAGVEAPDFTLNDIHGKPITLSSLRGKYVILDFWGSWCGWCIEGMPQMKEYYKKYAGKFEIVGVDCNDSEEKWKATVEKHQLPWLHVYNPKDSKVQEDYAIQGFPTKIVIGPDGKIVKTIVGEDPAFYIFLDETFGK